ncbi:MAG: DNA-formamidopyrimidine glycosylase, partial [Candidatus Pacebacteria bacterium]|nr:DNA-formamidopyrimidine glycosylase [Candidatus Paceibacterota bacterium]
WSSKIHPLTPANKLSKEKIKTLFNSIQKILKTAVALRGSSMRDYKDLLGKDGGYIKIRKVYMREGLLCLRQTGLIKCNAKIIKTKIGQRMAHFCPNCQKY